MTKSHSKIKLGKALEQELSPLFSVFPIDVRRVIYRQYWRNYGLDQHLYLFSTSSYVSHYPCLLEPDAFNHHRPPSPAPPVPEPEQLDADTEAEAEAEAGTATEAEDGDTNQPEPLDDPGDINGAIQDIAANPPQMDPLPSAQPPFTSTHQWDASPWCMHEACFQAYMKAYDMSFERAYSRNYKRMKSARAYGQVGLIKPFLVCRKMYAEASESLYTLVHFDFATPVVLDRFVKQVRPDLSARIQVVKLTGTWLPLPGFRSYWPGNYGHVVSAPLYLPDVCQKLPGLFPNLRELTLILHANNQRSNEQQLPLLEKPLFDFLYTLAEAIGNLRRFDVKLVGRCDMNEDPLAYGGTPGDLVSAPFDVKLVPRGWHAGADCVRYWTGDIK